jgi:hypothetical protein
MAKRMVYTVCSFMAFLLILVLAFIEFTGSMEYPGLPVLTGQIRLSDDSLAEYFDWLYFTFSIDFLLILMWMVSWWGMTRQIDVTVKRVRLYGLILGLTAAILDIGENLIIIWVAEQPQIWVQADASWLPIWFLLREFSYLLAFFGGAFILHGLFQSQHITKMVYTLMLVFSLAAVIGVYVPDLLILGNAWFTFWFLFSGIVLLRSKNHNPAA